MDIGGWVLLQLVLAKTTPLLLAGIGGLASERTGVINIALEGMMLAGAFGSAVGGVVTGSAWAGMACGALAGGLVGAVHALACLRLGMDHIVSGTAVNLLALGGTGFFLFRLFGSHGTSPIAPKLPMVDLVPGIEEGLVVPLTVPLAFAVAGVAWFVLFRTPYGLWIRATGEAPEAARSAGIRTDRVRVIGVLLSGVLAGLAGTHLALGDLSQFVERMTAGRGFIALAALVFGKWHPLGVLGACLFFGSAEAVADGLQGWTTGIPPQVFLALPFVLTMVVLAGFVGRSRRWAGVKKNKGGPEGAGRARLGPGNYEMRERREMLLRCIGLSFVLMLCGSCDPLRELYGRDASGDSGSSSPERTVGSSAVDSATSARSAAPTGIDAAGAAVVSHTYRVLRSYPHDRSAWTQGLVYKDGHLLESTGLYDQSSLRRTRLETGEVTELRALPAEYFGEGLTLFGSRIIQLTWRSRVGLVYDASSLEPLGTFPYSTEGWGLTHDGERLIMSDGSARLHFLDPKTFGPIGHLDVKDDKGPVIQLNELEYIRGLVYANVWQTDLIVMISPKTGQVVGSADLAGLLTGADLAGGVDVLNGIAYDPETDRLFVTGKLWPKVFEIVLVPQS